MHLNQCAGQDHMRDSSIATGYSSLLRKFHEITIIVSMNVDIDNQFHQYYRLRLTDSIFSLIYYLLIKNLVYMTYNNVILSFIFRSNIYMVKYL
jgi:hypothetical protein